MTIPVIKPQLLFFLLPTAKQTKIKKSLDESPRMNFLIETQSVCANVLKIHLWSTISSLCVSFLRAHYRFAHFPRQNVVSTRKGSYDEDVYLLMSALVTPFFVTTVSFPWVLIMSEVLLIVSQYEHWTWERNQKSSVILSNST